MSDKDLAVKEATDLEIQNLFDDESDAPEVEQLPMINIIHQAQLFEFPDGMTAKEFPGIILHTYKSNLWWKKSFEESGGGEMPDCWAIERIRGQKMIPDSSCSMIQSDACFNCQMNQFGSNNEGKACKNRRNVFIFVEGYFVPLWLQLAATSIKDFDRYIDTFPVKHIKYQQAMTNFKLEKKDNYSILKPSQTGPPNINIESLRALKEIIDKYMPLMYKSIVTIPKEQK